MTEQAAVQQQQQQQSIHAVHPLSWGQVTGGCGFAQSFVNFLVAPTAFLLCPPSDSHLTENSNVYSNLYTPILLVLFVVKNKEIPDDGAGCRTATTTTEYTCSAPAYR